MDSLQVPALVGRRESPTRPWAAVNNVLPGTRSGEWGHHGNSATDMSRGRRVMVRDVNLDPPPDCAACSKAAVLNHSEPPSPHLHHESEDGTCLVRLL